MIDVLIRKARPEDLIHVVGINRNALPENYSPEFFSSLLEEHGEYFLVAEREGHLIGYVMCRIETGFSFSPSLQSPLHPRGHIVSLAVDSVHRRKGIGEALMLATLAEMRKHGLKESYLEVRVDNTAAIAAYEKLGYKKSKKIDLYYADGTSAYVMTIDLQS